MRLELATWQEVEKYLHRSKGIIIPIGSTEQHGPIGLIGTDAICAQEIAFEVGEQTDTLVSPVIAVGMAQHHMAFPGTMTLRPSTLIAVITDTLMSLVSHGFERFFFINGHGGNQATIEAAFQEFHHLTTTNEHALASKAQCKLENWWRHKEVTELAEQLFGSDEGAHATPSEVAVTLHHYPELYSNTTLTKLTDQSCIINGAEDFRKRYPDGRIGADSSMATPELGARIQAAAVTALSREYQAFNSLE